MITGFAVRLGWSVYPGARSQDDETAYNILADNWSNYGTFCLVDSGGVCRPTAAYPPALPGMIAASKLIFGDTFLGSRLTPGRIATAVAGALVIALTFMLGAAVFGPCEGVLAAGIVAVNPYAVYWSGIGMTEAPFALVLVAGLALAFRPRKTAGAHFAEGLVWGSGILLRSTAGPIAVVIAAIHFARDRSYLKTGLVYFLLGLALLPGLWMTRNRIQLATWGLDSHGGYTFVTSNMFYKEYRADNNLATEALLRQPWYPKDKTEFELNAFLMAKTKEFVLANPGVVARQWANNIVQFWRLYPRQDINMPQGGSRKLFWLSLLSEIPLFTLMFIGIWYKRREWRQWSVVLMPAVILTLIHMTSTSQIRYRTPLIPLFAVLAGAGLCFLLEKIRASR